MINMKKILAILAFIFFGMYMMYGQGGPFGPGGPGGGGPPPPPDNYCQQFPEDPACGDNTSVPIDQGDWIMVIIGLGLATYTLTKMKKGVTYES